MLNLEKLKKIYIIGIEGAGTSALALILKQMSKEVSGSDEGDHFYYETLAEKGVKVFHQFSADNLNRETDLVVYSTAFNQENNQELAAALKSEIPVLSYPEALALLFNHRFGIAVCGTHGKTTTTAMTATVLDAAGLSPTALVGSKVKDWGSGALVGNSNYFVLEADEYQNKFQHYQPQAVILTSLDYDHPDFFPDFTSYKKVFVDLIQKIPAEGLLVAFAGDADVVAVAKEARCQVVFYGERDEQRQQKIVNDFEKAKKKATFYQLEKPLNLKMLGAHNQLNAEAALALLANLSKVDGDEKAAIKGLESFTCTARRVEELGQHRSGALVLDDYAHHPRELEVSLAAVKEHYAGKNIICVFHPHTFTRTKALLADFAKSLCLADQVIILDIFASARENTGEVTSADLAEKVNLLAKEDKARNIHTMEEVFDFLDGRLSAKDVVVTMGAGDVWKLGKRLVNQVLAV